MSRRDTYVRYLSVARFTLDWIRQGPGEWTGPGWVVRPAPTRPAGTASAEVAR